jgi:hypothetical protein
MKDRKRLNGWEFLTIALFVIPVIRWIDKWMNKILEN